MANRATNGEPTKTQLIQDFYKQGITSGKDILAKMEAAGRPSTMSMVYGTISNMKKKNGSPKGKRGRRRAQATEAAGSGVANGTATQEVATASASSSRATSTSARSNGAGSITLEDLLTIAALAKRVGGVEKLQAVVGALAGIL